MNKEEKQEKWYLNCKNLAEAFAKGDLNWHEKEWKDFIKLIRTETLQEVKDKMPKEKEVWEKVGKSGRKLLENNFGWNHYRSQMLEIIEKMK